MTFCNITLYQLKPDSEAEYLELLKEISRRKKEMRDNSVNQIIIGQNKPKFTIAVSIWKDEKHFNSWLKSQDRAKWLERYVDFYGDTYRNDILLNKKTEISENEGGLYGTFSRYVIKTGSQEEYLKAYKSIIDDINLKDFGARQTISLLDSQNNLVFSRVTIWESKEDLAKWRAAGTQIALMDKYLDHYIDTMEFDVLSILFP